jgi:hypothetical protein
VLSLVQTVIVLAMQRNLLLIGNDASDSIAACEPPLLTDSATVADESASLTAQLGPDSVDGGSNSPSISTVPTLSSRFLAAKTCVPQRCSCSCHRIWSLSGPSWTLELNPILAFLRRTPNCRCDAICFRVNLRLALAQYGIYKVFTMGLDLLFEAGRYTIHSALRIDCVVKNTSPGFEALWLCSMGVITFVEAKERLVELERSDTTFRQHVNPDGRSYMHVSANPINCFVFAPDRSDLQEALPIGDRAAQWQRPRRCESQMEAGHGSSAHVPSCLWYASR